MDFERKIKFSTYFIGFFIFSVFVLLFSYSFMDCKMQSQGVYERHAREQAVIWTNEMYPNAESHIVCQNQDTDTNGYISCTVRVGNNEPIPIECANPGVFYTYNRGCRVTTLQNAIQRTRSN
jgi:hypothetical protein